MEHSFFKKSRRYVIIAIALSILGSLVWVESFLSQPVAISKEAILWVRPGASVREVMYQLDRLGMRSTTSFLIAVYYQRATHRIQSGEYQVLPHESHGALLDKLVSGKVIQHAFTIVPGWDYHRLLKELKAVSIIEQTLNVDNLVEVIGNLHPEGQFFPETYYFTRGTSDRKILERAHRLMQEKLQDLYQRYTTDLTPYEVLILASIIERESHVPDEFGKISGVYTRRLQRKMPLQADPTVLYALGPEFSGMLTRQHLKTLSPYNTYRVRGLPPTPIALPSEKAIAAALNPEEGESLYFVSKGDGSGHVFSNTFTQHQKAVQQYRQMRSK